MKNITFAAKSAPCKEIFDDIQEAGLKAVELYLSLDMLKDCDNIVNFCAKYPFRYSMHAPTFGYDLPGLLELAQKLKPEHIVFHDIYFESEWQSIADAFKHIPSKICIENISSSKDPLKYIRKYGFGYCMDLEHLQMECSGIYREAFLDNFKLASYIHMTGYHFGSEKWHTHIHHSPEHNKNLLKMLDENGYSGWIVSEAKIPLQNYEEFNNLNNFINGLS